MNYAFAGTPLFAASVLRELVQMGRAPSLVVSQPDRPRGRGQAGSAPHAVREGSCHGLHCMQTDDINSPEVVDRLKSLGIGTLVVAAFGQILRRSLLETVDCVNIHASLLPKYRGAAPIERALMAGESVTGVSIMRITDGLDEGPWAEKVEVSVGPRLDAGTLGRILAVTGAIALCGVLDAIEDGTVRWTEQQGVATYATKLSSTDSWLDVHGGAKRAHDQVRALSPAVGTRAVLGEAETKIWRTWPYGEKGSDDVPPEAAEAAGRQGRIVVAGGRLFLGCREGVLEVLELQPSSRARMTTAAFLRGYAGRLGSEMRSVSSPTS